MEVILALLALYIAWLVLKALGWALLIAVGVGVVAHLVKRSAKARRA